MTSVAAEETRPPADPSTLAYNPGTSSLQDAWFPVAHSPDVQGEPHLRLVHSRKFFIWRDGANVRAADYHPNTTRRGEITPFTNSKGEYPLVERYGHVWVWYGDARRADPAYLPDIPFLPLNQAQPDFARGVNFFHCTYELVLENILDLTHIDFVHGAYAGTSDSEDDTIRFESTSETVTMIRTIRGRPTSKYQREVLGVTEPFQDMTAFTHVFIRSGVCFLHSHYSSAPSIPLMQSNTPESRTLTRANFVFGIQQTDHPDYAQAWPKTASIIAQQDEAVLSPQNPRYLGQPPRGDCSTRFDAAGLNFRTRYSALVERQARGDFSYLPDIKDGSDIAEILKVKRLN
jgi:phenylpropionate dioxygenase-like ring-hydroxylating dioxygenase large terminal subunit